MSLSLSTGARPAPASPAVFPQSGLFSVTGLTCIGLLLTIIMTLPVARQFMTTGYYRDPDDAMRMAEVRDFLNGQGWFDMTAWRLDPPHGVFMHWTRIVDVPIAMLVRFFEMFTAQEMAERLARLVFPLALLAGLLAMSARIARTLVGSTGPVLAILLTVFGGATFGYFDPGRVDQAMELLRSLVSDGGFPYK